MPPYTTPYTIPYHALSYHPTPSHIPSNTILLFPCPSIPSLFLINKPLHPADQSASSLTYLFSICITIHIYHTIPYHTIIWHTTQYHTTPHHTTPHHTTLSHTIPYHTIRYTTMSYYAPPPSSPILLPMPSSTLLLLPYPSIPSPFPLTHIHHPADQSASSLIYLFAICNTTYIYHTILYHTIPYYTRLD